MKISKPIAVLAAVSAIVVAGGTGATASGLISGAGIKNHTIGQIDLKPGVVKLLHRSGTGVQGPAGPAGPQGPAGANAGGDVKVSTLTGLFHPHSAAEAVSLKVTGDGIQGGPLLDGSGGGVCANPGVDYNRLDFDGLNGKTLAQVTQLDYNGWFVADNDTSGVGSLSMRIFTDDGAGGTNKYTYSPNTQFEGDNRATGAFDSQVAQGETHDYLVTSGTIRLNDDDGSNGAVTEQTFAKYQASHGSEKITRIDFLTGCTAGVNLTTLLRSVDANGVHYVLGKN